MFVIMADVGDGFAHRGDQFAVNLRGQFFDGLTVSAQRFRCERDAVEPRGEFDERRIAALADFADDGVGSRQDVVVEADAPAQDFFQLRVLFDARAGQFDDLDHGFKASVNRAISAPTSIRFR
ncbi:MAG: hypothetical protein JMDDDDMK_00814 [Acidobacteria bacterium]|nr:hypothetical protein [Acidobacteriota bacterium]